MREGTYIIRKGDEGRRNNAALHVQSLDHDEDWRVEITRYRKKRSLDQNAYIHAVPLKMISDRTGYDIEDIKTYLCGEFTGWVEHEVFGKKRVKPVKTTSKMNTEEMTQFIEWMIWYGADKMGITIPYPSEEVA